MSISLSLYLSLSLYIHIYIYMFLILFSKQYKYKTAPRGSRPWWACSRRLPVITILIIVIIYY